ncbi:MAG: glycine--tRNA ligase [Chloroflexi bacterium]|nr:glycine--tRNA ligase [Chloroflexota bacterium]OJV96000.1 MAG: glycine--tRNA ligase [Chloroflexi bacterium 54-19]
MDTIVSLCKRRGFVYPSAEIYGGFGSTYDYGPLGVELLRNVRNLWWKAMVQLRDDVVGLEASILGPEKVYVASGHVANFSDPLVDCKNCKRRWRLDHLEEGNYEAEYGPTKRNPKGEIICPACGGELSEPRKFNLMFKTRVGVTEDSSSVAYLRPETAQGMFINYSNIQTSTSRKLPFGIAQIGKSFRNEITPGNFVFRTREFEQMEMEFFVKPGTDDDWHDYWVKERYNWYLNLGIQPERLRLRPHTKDELSFYSKATSDVEYLFPWGWGELEGIANRTNYDLTQHAEHSGKDLSYFDEENKERIVPFVIEPAAGVTRTALTFLIDAYHEEVVNNEKRVVLRFHKDIAPVKVAVLPLSKKEALSNLSKEIARKLRPRWQTMYDETQAIGKRYRRQDEIGTPYCVTVDFDSLEDNAVTIRERDTMTQVRVPIDDLVRVLSEKLDA